MTRPHEDIRRHTAVDHHPGGPAIRFAPDAWCAIDIVSVKPERVEAAASAYATLIEQARASAAKAGASAVLQSLDNHRVIVLVTVGGHVAFTHLKSAWDDHHLRSEHRDVADSNTLGLYHVVSGLGTVSFDPQAKNVYAIEHVGVDITKAQALAQTTSETPGFQGALIFSTDDANASVLVYQFEHASEFAVVKTFG